MFRQVLVPDMAGISKSDWDSLADPNDALYQYEFYRLVTETGLGPNGFCFLTFYKADRIAAIVPLFWFNAMDLTESADSLWLDRIKSVFPQLFTIPTLFCGNLVGEGNLLIADWAAGEKIGQQILSSVHAFAREHKLHWIIFKDLNVGSADMLRPFIAALDYFPVGALPDAHLNVQVDSFDLFVKQFRSKRKQKIKKVLRDYHADPTYSVKVMETWDDEALLKDISDLYRQVFDKAEIKLDEMNEDFFKRLGSGVPGARLITLWHEEKLIAFILCLLSGDRCTIARIGMDYSFTKLPHLYFATHYEVLQFAIAAGYKHFNLTQASYHAKLEMGCHLESLTHIMTHTNPVFRRLFKIVMPKVLGDYKHSELVKAWFLAHN